MKPRHIAIVSGLALTLTFGAVQATTTAFADQDAEAAASADAASVATDDTDSSEQLPEPSDYDKSDFYEEDAGVVALSARSTLSSSLSSVSVSSEMKYFTKYESHGNYRQGFSYGDGYNALGYYQFDRRYSLISFLTQVYNTNPTKYSMLKAVIDRGSEVKSASSMYDSNTKTLTELGQLVQDAWYAAYDADPAEFSAFQDAYAYNSYYLPTETWLKSELGIDISGRADCVKGMVWGLSNMWGTGGVKKLLRGANLSNDMTDREFVTALAAQMTDNIEKYSSQTQYYTGWKNRYKNELNDCLAYISLHEQEAAAGDNAGGDDPSGDAADGSTGGSASDGSGDTDSGSSGNSGDSDGDSIDPDAGEDSGSGSSDDASDAGSNGSGSTDDSSESDSGSNSVDDETGDGASSGDSAEQEGGSGSSSNGSADSGGSGSAGDASGSDGATGADSDDPTDNASNGNGGLGGVSSESSNSAESSDVESTSDDAAATKDSESSTTGDDTDDDADNTANTDSDSSDDGDEATGGRMPQTSDLIVFTTFAAASAATFGATFVAAGKHGLRKRKDDDRIE